jgi:hypothetical protein
VRYPSLKPETVQETYPVIEVLPERQLDDVIGNIHPFVLSSGMK